MSVMGQLSTYLSHVRPIHMGWVSLCLSMVGKTSVCCVVLKLEINLNMIQNYIQ